MQALILEDDLEQGTRLADTLEDIGISCDLERDSAAANSRLLRHTYDLIILDVFVRDGNTLDLADLIKLRTPETAVIFLTGSAIFARGEHLSEVWGADWLLRKPVRPGDLQSLVAHVTGEDLRL